MITDLINKNGNYTVRFEDVIGSGWDDLVVEIISKKIKPKQIIKREIDVSWDSSIINYDIEHENIKFTVHFEDNGPNSFRLISEITEESKQKLRDWAMIVANEVEKQREKK